MRARYKLQPVSHQSDWMRAQLQEVGVPVKRYTKKRRAARRAGVSLRYGFEFLTNPDTPEPDGPRESRMDLGLTRFKLILTVIID